MKLRAATAADIPKIAQIMGDWCADTPYIPALHTRDQDRNFITKVVATQDVLVADHNGVQGFIARDGEDIEQLYVAAGARGRGIGSALLAAMKARSDRLELWCFQANTGARRFYERQGFSAGRMTDGASNQEKLPDIRYLWRADA
ncbi:L-amino acid N-acyltransferase YncA [Yoonia tamlensis]|uniref:L-amino acid N-acyltransferase YncA n=1 Tax=Yoonia tamlensis TaxID=390270 RepID=A0A1I6HPM4_9RHOB|nr:GNAT family N-acetyltransferase [Yoonia tamlensis]SFR56338.1 L-amino acid N-acyltransferase YncA [Yoonia tamlensis]